MSQSFARRNFLQGAALAGAAAGSLAGFTWPAAAQQRGGTLRIGVPESFSSLDPFKRIGRLDYNAVINIFDTLITYGPDYIPQPMLAERWERVNDLTWRFTLKQGVTFHDGAPFDAEAAKYSIEKMRTGNFGTQFRPIQEVVVTGPNTIEIRCSTAFPTILAQFTQQYASIVSPRAYEATGDNFGRQPVGSGPFRVERLEPSRELVLARNPNYWRRDGSGNALPHLDRVVWRVLPDLETASLALQNNEIEFLYSVPLPFVAPLSRNANVRISEAPTLGWEYIMFHCQQRPFDNVHARRAVQLAIDRQAIVETVSFGRAVPALGPITPRSWAYDPAIERSGFYGARANRDRARQELAQAGMPNGFEFPLIHPTSTTFNALAQALQSQLAEVGIRVALQGKEIGAVLDDLFASRFQALMIDWSGRIDEALTFPAFFGTGGGNNFGRFSNAEIDRVVTAAGAATEIPARAALYREAQTLIIQESPHVWITVPSELRAHRTNVEGFTNYGDVRIRAETITLRR